MAERKHPKAVGIRDINIRFATEEQCLEYIEQMRWPDGVVRCPTCGDKNVKRVRREAASKNKRPWFYLCLNNDCHQQFSPTAGTLFADSHLPLIVWFHAIGLMLNAKKGISAKQLQRDLGLGGYKTAWYLNHRIREAMQESNPQPLGGTVEIDETYIGGKHKGMYGRTRKIDGGKDVVLGIRQRKVDGHKGELRFFHAEDVTSGTLAKYIKENVSPAVDVILTDEFKSYPAALRESGIGTKHHHTIQHKQGVYAIGQIHTNTVESAFSLLKRGIIGSFHKISIKHLSRYLREFEYRFNRRADGDVFIETVRRLCRFAPLRFAALTSDETV